MMMIMIIPRLSKFHETPDLWIFHPIHPQWVGFMGILPAIGIEE
jgi:hypothetical protein